LQQASRFDEADAPAYLRTHPITGERIGDMQMRLRETHRRQAGSVCDRAARVACTALRFEGVRRGEGQQADTAAPGSDPAVGERGTQLAIGVSARRVDQADGEPVLRSQNDPCQFET
jgi:predicted Zn-dependent protease